MAKSNFTVSKENVFWLIVTAFAIAFVWLLNDILAPFITGLVIAYLLNPMVTATSKYVPRSYATIFVLLIFVIVVGGVFAILSPMIGRQVAEFIGNIPKYLEDLQNWARPHIDEVLSYMDIDSDSAIRKVTGSSAATLWSGTKSVLPRLLHGGKVIIDLGTFLVITPIVAFYCMRDWPNFIKKVDQQFPRGQKKNLRTIFKEFDMRLSGFLRGQLLVCISLGTIYAVCLTIVGVNYGLAIGFIAGILSFIPYVGSTFGLVASVGVAFVQSGNYELPMVALGIFFIGQFIEGNFLTPKLVGERVGLHPVWVIFALMAGGKLFGFTGLLLAVPVAAMIGVVVRHSLMWYHKSEAYLGDER